MNRADRRRLARKVRRVAAGTDTLTRLERHQLNAVLREARATLPVHIRDQADAAVEQIAAGMQAIIDEFGFTPAHTRSPKLTRPIDRVITRMLTGDCRTCRHVTATAPQPLSVCLWDDPPVFRCHRCIPDDADLTDEEDPHVRSVPCGHCGRRDLPDVHDGRRDHHRLWRLRRLPRRTRGGRSMTGVTATNPVDSRNTSVVDHWHDLRCRCCPPCERCDQRWVHNFDSCTDCGWCRWCAKHGGDVLPAFRPHCLTCHSTNHYACQECASCIGTVTDYGGRSRSDRRYCSNACRQRAYRHRKERTA